ncbi:MAG TPA: O-antigen ligase family protein, partial [Longimicrobiaceae bacterium]
GNRPRSPLFRRGGRRDASLEATQAAPAPESPAASLYSLHPRELWRFMKTQKASFWLICLYLFLEYVRPQSIYDALAGPPYTRIALILCVICFFLEGKEFRFRTPADITLGVFTAVVLVSSLAAWKPEASWAKMPDYLSWVLIYLLIANVVTTEKRWLVFVLGFMLWSFKMSQHGTRSWAEDGFAFRDWGTTGAPGFFQNSGEFGIQMCVFLPMIVFFITGLGRHWSRLTKIVFWGIAVTAVTGIVASSSRGALIGMAAVALWLLMKTRYRFRALVGIALFTAFVVAILPREQKDRLNAMGKDDDKTSVSRKEYWKHGREIIATYPVLGIGYENWADYHETNYGVRALPHNIFIQAGAELGYTGLAAFGAMIVATFWVNRKTRKIAKTLPDGRFLHDSAHGLDGALVGFLVSGSFVTVLYYPFFWINLALTVALYNSALDSRAAAARGIAGEEPEIPGRPLLRGVA